jgi:hypothetical protein
MQKNCYKESNVAFLFLNKDKFWMPLANKNIFNKSKMLCKTSIVIFVLGVLQYKFNFQGGFDGNISGTCDFILQIFRASEKAPPLPFPHHAVQGVG